MEEQVPFSKDEDGRVSQKNSVGNLDNVQNARIGDETHTHFYTARTPLPKDITTSIPKISPNELVGREEDLKELHELLSNGDRVVVVNGLGGIGKTTLAQAYVGQYYENYKHVAWITQTSESIVNDLINTDGLISVLNVEAAGWTAENLFHAIVLKLKSIEEKPNLLVIDNAEQSLSGYRYMLPGPPNWRLLVTSREEMEEFQTKRLDFLEEEQAVQLFKKHYTLRKLKNEEIRELVKAVDYHTLAIEILAKTAKVQRYTAAKLKQAIEDDLRANVKVGRQQGQVERIGSYLSAVFNLSRLNEGELWLMKQFVCLPPEFHTYDLLHELTVSDESPYGELFAETISGLAQKGWLLYNPETDRYKMHRIIAGVVKKQHEISVDDVSDLIQVTTQKLEIDQTKDNVVEKFPWVPFGKNILEHFQANPDERIGALQYDLATVLRELGDFKGARALLEKAVQISERNFGPEHPTTATNYSTLGVVLRDLGDYKAARILHEKAVQSYEENLGLEHPFTAASYSNLATVLQELGDYEEARALLEKAVQSNEKNFGPEHPTTVISYSNLAMVLQDLKDYEGAKVLMEKAVKSDERTFGSEHPSTIRRYSNLALVLRDLEDYEGARPLLEKAVQSNEKNFGLEHPTTAVSYCNLGIVLEDLGDYEGAKALLEKAVQSEENNFGPEHPTTAISYSNLALVVTKLGDIEAALELSAKALNIFMKTLPAGHPYILKATETYEFIKNLAQK